MYRKRGRHLTVWGVKRYSERNGTARRCAIHKIVAVFRRGMSVKRGQGLNRSGGSSTRVTRATWSGRGKK